MTKDDRASEWPRAYLRQSPVTALFVSLSIVVLVGFAAIPKHSSVAFTPEPRGLATSCPKLGCNTSSWWYPVYSGIFTFPANAASAEVRWNAAAAVLFFIIPPIPCGTTFCFTGYNAAPSDRSIPAVICLSMGIQGSCQFSTTSPANQTWVFEALSPVPLGDGFNFGFEGAYDVPGPNLPW
ncbi:MAG: hypothetical protein L3K14_04520 [Thermoplasmata archaeon]|nr:hypothetical protein [Thermoplasmata archaeon]